MLSSELKEYVAAALACPVESVWLKDGIYYVLSTSKKTPEPITILVKVMPAEDPDTVVNK